MKCPKCGYHSFEHLDSCKKCSQSLSDHKAKYNLRGFISVGATALAETPVAADEESINTSGSSDNESSDFGFDFLDEEEDQTEDLPESARLDIDTQHISLDQPFSVDGEAIPEDAPAGDKNKPDKGPAFAL